LESKEQEYLQRLEACYPIHPEVFDRLYEDWSTLERFQRTRGVLRLMASVIHELWMSNDAGLMIMPGSIPMDVPNVRDELTRHLSEGWNAIVDSEVDGKSSIPYQKDQTIPRYGVKLAARRVARTIMLGSAPTDRAKTICGLEASRIRLGVVQPGETIADFNDALNTLQTSLTYLYTNPSQDRYGYDTRPTLRKTVEDRATQVSVIDVEYEIVERLRKIKREKPLAGIHICPGSSLDVPDDRSARLVILHPADEYAANQEDNPANTAMRDILNNRGTSPRIYRNMLVFIAPDQELISSLKHEVQRYLAWRSVKEDSQDLNLDAAQNRETDNNLKRSNETVDLRIIEAYCWLFVPYIDRDTDMKTIVWEKTRISGGNDEIVAKAVKKLLHNEALITKWAPALLLMELDKLLWRDSNEISIKQLWDYLCTYCYLPRLVNYEVLENTILTGLNSSEYFAIASAVVDGRYVGLKYRQSVDTVDKSELLVKVAIAGKQIDDEQPNKQTQGVPPMEAEAVSDNDAVRTTPVNSMQSADRQQPHVPNTHFYMSAPLDNTRINRDVQKLIEEVIGHLATIDGAQLEVTLEINLKASKGIPAQTIRTVSENCRTLKIKDFGFDE
jgi:hypothetical protein